MAEALHTDAISIYVEHLERSALSVAHFTWIEGSPIETYRQQVGVSTNLEFDSHFPVRPHIVRLRDEHDSSELDSLTSYIGKDIVDALLDTKSSGSLALKTTLNIQNRLAIANLQLTSPGTPRMIKIGCLAMLRENARVDFSNLPIEFSVGERDDDAAQPPAA